MTHYSDHYDIVIIGGGLVGLSLALALEGTEKRIAVIEAQAPRNFQHHFDTRSIALSYTSQQFFKSLGCWDVLENHTQAIKTIHVSDKGYFAATRLCSSEVNAEALGYVVPLDHIIEALIKKVCEASWVSYFSPYRIDSLIQANDTHSLTTLSLINVNDQTTRVWTTNLLIAADGNRSSIENFISIDRREIHYNQVATVANIGLARDHNAIAHERFTKSGPIALLPMTQQRANLVWVTSAEESSRMSTLTENEFLSDLQDAFGYRLGRFIQSGKRQQFPLILSQCTKPFTNSILMLGNAMHTLHPVAGQGFNLCVREVAHLAQSINSHRDNLHDAVLAFLDITHTDQTKTIELTNTLVNIFSTDITPLTIMRGLGVLALDTNPLIKKTFIQTAMGFRKNLAKRICGIPMT